MIGATSRSPFAKSLVLRPAASISLRLHRRSVLVVLVGAVVCTAVALVGLMIGDYPLSVDRIVAALLGAGGEDERQVVLDGRLPRIATGLFVGMALGASGAVVQAIARNPLASPDILGISAGASLGAVLVLLVTAGSAGVGLMSAAAVAGAGTVAAVVLGISWRRGLVGFRLLLIGIGISASLGSVTSFALIKLNPYDIQRLLAFISGDLYGSRWSQAVVAAAAVVVIVPLVLAQGSQIRALELGDDVARAVGIQLGRSRGIALLLSVVLAGAAVAAAGPVAFVALVAPQIARLAAKSPGMALGPSIVVGAALVLTADLVGRRIFAPVEIPVGLITAIVGAPVMLILMVRAARDWRTAA